MKKLNDMSLEELWDLFPIIFVNNNSKYEEQYKEEERNLKVLLNDYIIRISHIGSTSIKNIKTKPIVDILIEVSDYNNIGSIKEKLLKNNYLCMNEDLEKNRISFNKGYTINGYDNKVFHIHIKKYKDCDELYFRDYLNDNYDCAKEYEKLKLRLYEKYKPNRDLYTEFKTDFVVRTVKLARKKYMNRY